MKSAEFIGELTQTRGKPWGFMANFLGNYARSARLMHAVLPLCREKKDLLSEAMRGYVVAITSALETYYRDVYVYVLSQDEASLRRVLQDVREKATLAELHSLLADGVSFSEIVASEATFQNLAAVEKFMSKLFQPIGYLDTLGGYEHDCVVPVRGARTIMKLGDGWRTDLASIYSRRHAFVHDANKQCDLSPKEMQRLETVALLIPQMTAELVSKKFDSKGTFRMGSLPVLLLVEDLISDEWEVSDGAGIRIQH